MEENLVDTLKWQRLRHILLDALQKHDDPHEASQLMEFVAAHWNNQVPRQNEVASMEQALRREVRDIQYRLEHEIELREQIANTMTYERPLIDEVG